MKAEGTVASEWKSLVIVELPSGPGSAWVNVNVPSPLSEDKILPLCPLAWTIQSCNDVAVTVALPSDLKWLLPKFSDVLPI